MRWYAVLLSGICCISTSAILVTLAAAPPTLAAFYRNFLAALIWLLLFPYSRPFAAMPGKKRLPAYLGSDKVRFPDLIRGAGAATLLAMAGFFFAIDLWAWHRCIIFLGAGPATLMGNLQVLFVSLLAVYFWGERLQKWFWPGCLLALTGIGLLTLTKGIGSAVVPGIVYGILTALTYSLFILCLKFLDCYETRPQQILFWVAVMTAFFLLLSLAGEDVALVPTGRAFLILSIHALLSSVIGWWMIIAALPHIPVSVASTLLLLQPVLTNVWGHLFLQQFLLPVQILGICVALIGIRLATWRASSAAEN